MDSELLKTIFGSAGIVTLLIGAVGGAVKLYQNRVQARREDDADAANWNADYRAYAEKHLPWDQEMRQHVLSLQLVVSDLQRKLNMPVTDWPKIEQAPPLFPPSGREKK